MPPIIKVSGLSKKFKEITAVDDLSFSVEENCIYGFLGQNGAGKSTTIRMLLTLVKPDSGEIEIFGHKLPEGRTDVLRQTGALIEKPDLYKYLTAFENLKLFARLSGVKYGRKELLDQLDHVGLAHRANDTISGFSQGMKQRLGIAVALVNDPQLVILDEPVNGLDPQGIADIRNLIIRLRDERKKTVVLSSHLLHEIELTANRMLIIHKGRKVVEGSVAELLSPETRQVELVTANNSKTEEIIRRGAWASFLMETQPDKLLLNMDRSQIPAFTAALAQEGAEIISIRPRHNLEDYFLKLTGH
jgi:ABC-type multidrug transport system ATPase subunit